MPPQGPRTTPPRTRPPAPLPDPEPEPSSKGRGLAIAASILAVLLIAGIAYAIVQGNKGENNAADPSSTPVTTSETPVETSEKPTRNTPAPTTGKPAQTKPSPPPPSTKPPATKFTAAQVVTFVKQHYGKLPKNPGAARGDWDPDNAPQASADDEYWKTYSKVAIKGNPLVTPSDDGTFPVTTTLELTEAETNKVTTEDHTLTISGKGEKLLITAEDRG